MDWPSFLQRFRGPSRSHLGIDIGNAAIKIVELAAAKEGPRLVNYGELKTLGYLRQLRESSQNVVMSTPENVIAGRIRQILEAAGVRTRQASMSIPLYSSFFSTLELPPMSRTELQEAITFEARQIVPVPLTEVILDWEIIGRVGKIEEGSQAPREKLLILLVAVPKEVVDRYVRIAKLAAIELDALEVEAFSLVRAALRHEKRIVVLADIGARATSLLLIEDGTIRMSHSLETAGSNLTAGISNTFHIDVGRAESQKVEQGIREGVAFEVLQMLETILGSIAAEISHMVQAYQRTFGKHAEALVLSGGSAGLSGIERYFAERLPMPVSRADPFRSIVYPKELEPVLSELGLSFATAVGLALRRALPINSAR